MEQCSLFLPFYLHASVYILPLASRKDHKSIRPVARWPAKLNASFGRSYLPFNSAHFSRSLGPKLAVSVSSGNPHNAVICIHSTSSGEGLSDEQADHGVGPAGNER